MTQDETLRYWQNMRTGGYLKEAYEEAEKFSELLQKRMRGAGFFKALLLRRLGSSMEAGRNTVGKLLGVSPGSVEDEDEDDADEDLFGSEGQEKGYSEFRNFTTEEIDSLQRCLHLLKQGGNRDPKLEAVLGYLLGTNRNASERWLDRSVETHLAAYSRWCGDGVVDDAFAKAEQRLGQGPRAQSSAA